MADPSWKVSIAAFHHSTFAFGKDSHFLVAVPGKLQNYDLERLFANNLILCLDEADTLLSSAENVVTKEILKIVQNRKTTSLVEVHNTPSDSSEKSHTSRSNYRASQVILTAATLPSRGPKNVGNQVLRLFPRNSVTLLKTENTHKILPLAKLKFTTCTNMEAKFSQLVEDLDSLLTTDNLASDRDCGSESSPPKVLIFVNTVRTASAVSNFLHQSHGIAAATSTLETRPKWWEGKVGSFFKQPGVFAEQREQVLRNFRRGSVRVLVCSDMGSRGLDFPDCNAVVQFDFPENAEHFLHRAGRTARAGLSGKGECTLRHGMKLISTVLSLILLGNVFSASLVPQPSIERATI